MYVFELIHPFVIYHSIKYITEQLLQKFLNNVRKELGLSKKESQKIYKRVVNFLSFIKIHKSAAYKIMQNALNFNYFFKYQYCNI